MNSNTTKTMRLPPRRLMTSPRPNKRKEREGLDDDEAHQVTLAAKVPKLPLPLPSHPNQLLAGYLAHEFLTKRTILGETWDDPDLAVAVASSSPPPPPPPLQPIEKRQAESQSQNYESYVEVANLLKHSGAYLEGIVNPTLLARFLNL